MGFLGRLKERFAPKRRDDPLFGSLLDMGGYWEGAGLFPPTGTEIEWFVDGGEEGPGEGARAAFRAIVERYAEIEPVVLELLGREIAERIADAAPPTAEVVTLVAISVPAAAGPEMSWELSYDCSLGRSPHLTVEMRGWRPTGDVVMDT